MSLSEEIKKRMFSAMKAGNVVEKEILRVALGEITTAAGRASQELSDEEVQGILKKLLKSNREALASTTDEAKRADLERENEILEGLLPRALSPEEIVAALEPVHAALRAAPAAGPAVGQAMKHLRAAGLSVEAPAVQAAIEKIRS